MFFERVFPVRFDEVDWARVVYYPRLFGYTHRVFEEFFAAEVGISYAQMLTERRVGFPTVHTEADFRAPLRFGDACRVRMTTVRVGGKSLTSRYQLIRTGAEQLCAELQVTTVSTCMDQLVSVQMPQEVRTAFERFA